MKILTRYVIRAHIGPFLFAFTAVTGLLFLNAVAQRMEDLAGRGLDWTVIAEFMVLSLPHIVALTFPMSILVAVLYSFSEMTGQNEVAAMAAGGIHPVRIMVPLVFVGLVLTGAMFIFNDRILPESNRRLSGLLADVGSTNPTFQLREDIVNEIHTGDDTRHFLRASTIETETNRLGDVTIYDLSTAGEWRTIVAERGQMAFTPDRRDLFLTLEDGTVFETSDERPGGFQKLDFETQILPIRGVGQELQRQAGDSQGEREMTVRMLQDQVDEYVADIQELAGETHLLSVETVDQALGLTPVPDDLRDDANPELPPEYRASFDPLVNNAVSVHRVNASRWQIFELASYRYRVEVHKKYAIAFACLIFVLLGPPLAMRVPQGGVGMVIAASVGIFFFYWMCLIGGERFADRGQMNPVTAMWFPNLILLIPALIMMARVAGQISTNRGSLWDELSHRVRVGIRKLPGVRGPLQAEVEGA